MFEDIPDSFGALPPTGKVVSRECQNEDVKQRWTSTHVVASKKERLTENNYVGPLKQYAGFTDHRELISILFIQRILLLYHALLLRSLIC